MDKKLREKIFSELAGQKGHVGFWYRNLITGEELDWHGKDRFRAASVYKLPLFMYYSLLEAEGRISMDERITVRNADKVPVCGALTLFTDEPAVDIRTLCNLMISLSDNTAANVLLGHIGMEEVRRGFRRMGLRGTEVQRRLFDYESAKRGLDNWIVPAEMGMLLGQIYDRSFVSREVSEKIEWTLMQQQINHKICGAIGSEYEVAHKTGEDEGLSNDVGLVYADQPFIVCYAGYETDVYRWEDFMRRITRELCEDVRGKNGKRYEIYIG